VTPASVAARGRGAAAGALTAALATAAHTWAGGAAPSGAAVALLGVLSLTLGAVAATARVAGTVPGLMTLLASGQVVGHLLLGAAGHQHAATTPSAAVMTGAHVAAVTVCALLITTADRFGTALSRAVLAITPPESPAPPVATGAVTRSADHPRQATLLLAASLSHRGPPVGVR
jgi:hypothetical protein